MITLTPSMMPEERIAAAQALLSEIVRVLTESSARGRNGDIHVVVSEALPDLSLVLSILDGAIGARAKTGEAA